MITERIEQLPAFLLLMVLMPVLYLYILKILHVQQRAHEAAENESILTLQADNLRTRVAEYAEAEQKSREERHNLRHLLQAVSALAAEGRLTSCSRPLRTTPMLCPKTTCAPTTIIRSSTCCFPPI